MGGTFNLLRNSRLKVFLITFVLSLVLAISTLTGCGGGKQEVSQESGAPPGATTPVADRTPGPVTSQADFDALVESLLAEARQELDAQVAELEKLLNEVSPDARPAVERALEDARSSRDAAVERIKEDLEKAKLRFRQSISP